MGKLSREIIDQAMDYSASIDFPFDDLDVQFAFKAGAYWMRKKMLSCKSEDIISNWSEWKRKSFGLIARLEKLKEKFKHKKTGGEYEITGKALLKNVKSRDWGHAIIYSALAGSHKGQIYVREIQDFNERFVSIEEIEQEGGHDCPFCGLGVF